MDFNLTTQKSTELEFCFETNIDYFSYKIKDSLILEVTQDSDAYISAIGLGSDAEWPERVLMNFSLESLLF